MYDSKTPGDEEAYYPDAEGGAYSQVDPSFDDGGYMSTQQMGGNEGGYMDVSGQRDEDDDPGYLDVGCAVTAAGFWSHRRLPPRRRPRSFAFSHRTSSVLFCRCTMNKQPKPGNNVCHGALCSVWPVAPSAAVIRTFFFYEILYYGVLT